MIFQENWETSFQINELCTLQDYAIAWMFDSTESLCVTFAQSLRFISVT